jgi:DNA-3-methyladenine glycosylase
VSRFRPLPLSFYRRPAEAVARDLLGRYLVRELDGERLALRLVETEAYLGAPDRASHAWGGRRTPRNESLYLAGGHAYVYFIYGMHYCLNLAAEQEGSPGCVLVRAAEPLWEAPATHLSGPGRLCRGLQIDTALSGGHLFAPGSTLYLRAGRPPARVGTSARIGITKAAERPLRFFDADSPAVTRFRGRVTFSRASARR